MPKKVVEKTTTLTESALDKLKMEWFERGVREATCRIQGEIKRIIGIEECECRRDD